MVEIQAQYSKVKKIEPWKILCPQIGMKRVNDFSRLSLPAIFAQLRPLPYVAPVTNCLEK